MIKSFHTTSESLLRCIISFCFIYAWTKTSHHHIFVKSNGVPSPQPASSHDYRYKNKGSYHNDAVRNINSSEKNQTRKMIAKKRRKKRNILILHANKLVVKQQSSPSKVNGQEDDKSVANSFSTIRNKCDNASCSEQKVRTQKMLRNYNNQDSTNQTSRSRNRKDPLASSSHQNQNHDQSFDKVNREGIKNAYSELSSLLVEQELPKLYLDMQQSIQLDKKLSNQNKIPSQSQSKRRTKIITRTKVKRPKAHSTILSSLDLLHNLDVSDKYESLTTKERVNEKSSLNNLHFKRDLNDEEFETLLKDLLKDEALTDNDDIYYDEEIWESDEYDYNDNNDGTDKSSLKTEAIENERYDYYDDEDIYDSDYYDMSLSPSITESDDRHSSLRVHKNYDVSDYDVNQDLFNYDNIYDDEFYQDYYEYDDEYFNEEYDFKADSNRLSSAKNDVHYPRKFCSINNYDESKSNGQYDQWDKDIVDYHSPASKKIVENQFSEETFEADEKFDEYNHHNPATNFNSQDKIINDFEDEYDEEETLDEEELLLLEESSIFGCNTEVERKKVVVQNIQLNPILRLFKKTYPKQNDHETNDSKEKRKTYEKSSSKNSLNAASPESSHHHDNHDNRDQSESLNNFQKKLGPDLNDHQRDEVTDVVEEDEDVNLYDNEDNIPSLKENEKNILKMSPMEPKKAKSRFLMTSLSFIGKQLAGMIDSMTEVEDNSNEKIEANSTTKELSDIDILHDDSVVNSDSCKLVATELEEKRVELLKDQYNITSENNTITEDFGDTSMFLDEFSDKDNENVIEEKETINLSPPLPPPPPPPETLYNDSQHHHLLQKFPPPPPPPDILIEDNLLIKQHSNETESNYRNSQLQESILNSTYSGKSIYENKRSNLQDNNDEVNNFIPPLLPPPPPLPPPPLPMH